MYPLALTFAPPPSPSWSLNFGKGLDKGVTFKQLCTVIEKKKLFELLLCAGPALGLSPL